MFLTLVRTLASSDNLFSESVFLMPKQKTTSGPPFFLRDSRASETRARLKITPREKRRHAAGRAHGVIFTRARVSLANLYIERKLFT